MKIHKPLFFGALSLALLSTSAFASTIPQSWDADQNGYVSAAEWNEAFDAQGVFNRLDDNNSGIFEIEESDENFVQYNTDFDYNEDLHISRDELELGLFNMYDKDDNDRLSAEEFKGFGMKLQHLDS